MKRLSTTLFTRLNKEELAGITNIVKEVVAVGHKTTSDKIFSAADLWNIQRQKRTFVQRRFSL
jgi:hypothetical protein